MFQAALYLEEAEGDLAKALKAYLAILAGYPEERAVAAKAQLHIGLCYEKLGLKDAQKAFERVVEIFPDQESEVKIARQRLARLEKAKAVIEGSGAGLATQKLFEGINQEFMGAPSPDGRFLSMVDRTTGDLAVKTIPSGTLRRLTHKPAGGESAESALLSVWSPDGKEVAYSWLNEEGFLDLRIIGLDDEKPRVLYRNRDHFMIQPKDWSPDGRYILVGMGDRQRVTRVATISVQDGKVLTLAEGLVHPGFFIPGGRAVIYSFTPETPDSRGQDIALLPAEGGERAVLVAHPAHDIPLAWDVRGGRFLFLSDRTGNMDLWALEMDGDRPRGAPYLLKKDMGRITPLGFTNRGDFYFLHYTGMNDVYAAALDPKANTVSVPAARAATLFIGANRSPVYSPDGTSLAFISERAYGSGRFPTQVIRIRSLETGETRELFPDLAYMHFIRWLDGGAYFITHGFDTRGRTGLFTIDARTGALEFLLECRDEGYIPELDVFPDGHRIVYKLWEQGKGKKAHRMSIRVRDLQNGRDEEIFRRETALQSHCLALSSDGQWIAFDDRVPVRTLNVVRSEGGEAVELWRLEPGESLVSLAWRPGSRDLFFVKPADPSEVWRIDREGGQPWRTNLSWRGIRELQFHPDGCRLAFSAGYVEAEVWVMENLFRLERSEKIFK